MRSVGAAQAVARPRAVPGAWRPDTLPRTTGIFVATTWGTIWQSVGGARWHLLFYNSNVGNPQLIAMLAAPGGQILYMSPSSQGYVWRSLDGGTHWRDVGQGLHELGILAFYFALDPQHPFTVYAAGSGGFAITTDGGQHWTRVGHAAFRDITALALDPHQPTHLWVGTAFHGAYTSDDGGVTWQLMGSLPGGSQASIDGITVSPATGSTVYVVTPTTVYISRDGGQHWTTPLSGLPQGQPDWIGLTVSPMQPTQLYIGSYVSGTYVSHDGGQYWTRTQTPSGAGLPVPDPRDTQTAYVIDRRGVAVTTNAGLQWHALPAGPLPLSNTNALAATTIAP
jgi:photosystem II stability/assembly factor-like uncharacterized protein